jgi:hypothetical protein
LLGGTAGYAERVSRGEAAEVEGEDYSIMYSTSGMTADDVMCQLRGTDALMCLLKI